MVCARIPAFLQGMNGMRRTRLVAMVTVVMLATGSLAGVAGASAPAKKKQLTKAQFIKKADKICEDSTEELQDLIDEYFGDLGPGEEPTDEALRDYADEFLPLAQEGHDAIRKLKEPKRDHEQVEELLAAQQDALDAVDEDPSNLISSNGAFDESSELARAYGFEVCGSQ